MDETNPTPKKRLIELKARQTLRILRIQPGTVDGLQATGEARP